MLDVDSPYYGCKIKDIFLASYLHSLGFPETVIVSPQEGSSEVITFDFADVSQEAVLSYFNSEFTIKVNNQEYTTSPKKLFLALRELRQKSYQVRSER